LKIHTILEVRIRVLGMLICIAMHGTKLSLPALMFGSF
jgi:hypothetical protein